MRNATGRPEERPASTGASVHRLDTLPDHVARLGTIRAGRAFRGSRADAARELFELSIGVAVGLSRPLLDDYLDHTEDRLRRLQRIRRRFLAVELESERRLRAASDPIEDIAA